MWKCSKRSPVEACHRDEGVTSVYLRLNHCLGRLLLPLLGTVIKWIV